MAHPVVFFSDVHIGAPNLADDKEREQKVIKFLEYFASNNAEIYIVGDLYEFWFEYKEVIPNKNIPLLACLYNLAANGLALHYVRGNHDLWIDAFFHDEVGLQVHKTDVIVNAGGKKIYATHGDGLAEQDSGYRFLKKIFTNKWNIKLYRWLHPDFGIPMAKRFSQVSRDQGAPDFAWESQYREKAIAKLAEGYDGFIMGHTHWPLHEIIAGKHYLNLGDWITHFSYCEINDGTIELKQWPSKQIYKQAKFCQEYEHLLTNHQA